MFFTLYVIFLMFGLGSMCAYTRLLTVALILKVIRRIGAGDVVARPMTLPGPCLGEPHLTIVGLVVLATLPSEGVRLAVIGAGPGELCAALGDGRNLLSLSGGGEQMQLDLADACLMLQLFAVIIRQMTQ